MNVDKVSEIPEIEYRFQLSEETKNYIGLLRGMKNGEILQFCPDSDSAKSLKIQLREIRDRLKTAIKKVGDDFFVCRRKNKYYVKRLGGGEDFSTPKSKITFRD